MRFSSRHPMLPMDGGRLGEGAGMQGLDHPVQEHKLVADLDQGRKQVVAVTMRGVELVQGLKQRRELRLQVLGGIG